MLDWSDLLDACLTALCPAEGGESQEKRGPFLVRPHVEAACQLNVTDLQTAEDLHVQAFPPGLRGLPDTPVSTFPHGSLARLLPVADNREVLGVMQRPPAKEDLYLFYRALDTALIVEVVPGSDSAHLVLASRERGQPLWQVTLDGSRHRAEFSGLCRGEYLLCCLITENPQDLFEQAQGMRESGMRGLALEQIELALKLAPRFVDAWVRKAYLLRETGRPEEAMATVDHALSLDANHALGWRAKGALYRDSGKHEAGLNCYLRSLELDPTDYLCWENKGNALMALDRTEEAEGAYKEAAQVRSSYPEGKF
jgi:hypothetical protein